MAIPRFCGIYNNRGTAGIVQSIPTGIVNYTKIINFVGSVIAVNGQGDFANNRLVLQPGMYLLQASVSALLVTNAIRWNFALLINGATVPPPNLIASMEAGSANDVRNCAIMGGVIITAPNTSVELGAVHGAGGATNITLVHTNILAMSL